MQFPNTLAQLSLGYYGLLVFSIWRITHLFVDEAGPFDILIWFRRIFGIQHDAEGFPVIYPENVLAKTLSCFWCLSFWTTLLMLGLILIDPIILIPLGVWGIVVFLESFRKV